MKTLKNNTVYIIATAASKIRELELLVHQLSDISARVKVIATPNAQLLLQRVLHNLPDNVEVQTKGSDFGQQTKLPAPDAVIVAPATFNTVNKMASGIADSHALTIIATAIASHIPVIVAPSYDTLWNHPSNKGQIEKLQAWGAHVVFPDLEQDHITMAPTDKIVDSYRGCFEKIKFQSTRLEVSLERDLRLKKMREKYGATLRQIGTRLQEEGLNYGINGCFSVREDDWMLITATGAQLANLENIDLTLVAIDDSLRDGLVYWYGDKLPSSETPLHVSLYQRISDIACIAHTHARHLTYGIQYADFKTKAYIPYGEFGNINELLELIEKYKFGIMRLHGEVIVGDTPDTVHEKLKSYLTPRL